MPASLPSPRRALRASLAALLVAGAAVAAGACASGPRVQSDLARGAGFASWQSFAFYNGELPASQGVLPLGPDLRIRSQLAVRDQLVQKGWREVSMDASPDFVVVVGGSARESGGTRADPYALWVPGATANTANVGRLAAQAAGTTGQQVVEVGTLVVAAYDPKARKLAWRGEASDAIQARRELDEKLPAAVGKMMARFPAKR